MRERSFTTRDVAMEGLLATVYIAVSLLLMPITFGAVQLRISEMLMMLPFYNKKHAVGLTIGCLITNMFSPFGLVDIVFGTLATALACLFIIKLKQEFKLLVPVIAAVVNGIIVGAELYFVVGAPLMVTMLSVFAGELAAVGLGLIALSLVEKRIPGLFPSK